ncbi:uncharacterized protein IUM83_01206 [Phytophthora cinnamomi]|uniref:uncharacterized protein n=1 Tax=Phytophthora cinnamomi TaxID=4785 RepID=UPI00355962DA|nr:hypothetical protein IUM83_01206 [Phytophthora cinnamomi]
METGAMMALEAKLGSVTFEVELDSVVLEKLEALEAKLGSVVGGAEPRLEVDSGRLGVLEDSILLVVQLVAVVTPCSLCSRGVRGCLPIALVVILRLNCLDLRDDLSG